MASIHVHLMGGNGMILIDDTGAKTTLGDYQYILVREDTVIGTCTDENSVNLITQWDISGVTLIKGDLLVPGNRTRLSTLTLTSGSVWLIKG